MASPARFVRVVVSDPAKQGEGMSAFISYKVSSEFLQKVEGLTNTNFSVIRRFSDFVWLRDSLRASHPFLLLPPLPDKQALGRLNAEFVDVRHRALQRWMDRLTAHAGLADVDAVKKFLTFPNEAFSSMREASRSASTVVQAAASTAGTSVVKFIKATASSISNAVAEARGTGGTTSTHTKGKSAEDLSFEELETYLFNQGPLLTQLYNTAASVAIQYREQAQLLLDFGASLRALGVTESGALGNALSAAGLSTWAASTAAYEEAVEESELWVEKLADMVRGIRSIKDMMHERTRSSSALQEALSNVERLRAHITALATSPSPSAAVEKAKAEAELATAQSTVTDARAYYDKVATSVIAEVERYRLDLRADFRNMLLDFTTIQIRNATKLAQAWERAVPDCTAAIALEGATPLPSGLTVTAALSDFVGGGGGSGDPTSYPAVPPAGKGDSEPVFGDVF